MTVPARFTVRGFAALFVVVAVTHLASCASTSPPQDPSSQSAASAEACCGPLREFLESSSDASDTEGTDNRQATNVVSLVDELDYGQRGADAIAAKHKVSDSEDLNRIVARLARFSDRPVLDYDVKLLEETAQIMAFSIAGGHLYVSESLLEQMEPTEGELAFVLAHEMAHAALRHMPSMMERWWWSNMLTKIRVCDAAAHGRIAGSAVCPTFEALDIAESMTNLEAEFAADQFGALYLVQAGYEFSDAVSFFKKLMKIMGDVNQFGTSQELAENSITSFPTHPPISQRIDQLERFRNQLLQVAASVEEAIQDFERRDYESAAQALGTALKVFPESRAIRMNLALAHHLMFRSTQQGYAEPRGTLSDPEALEVSWADLLKRGPAGESDAAAFRNAVDGYARVLAFDTDYYPARNNLAVAHLDNGNVDKAINELEGTLSSNRSYAPAYRNLTLAYLQKLDADGPTTPEAEAALWLDVQRAWTQYKYLQSETQEADAMIEQKLASRE
jgi:predicted Zn-dependent protease